MSSSSEMNTETGLQPRTSLFCPLCGGPNACMPAHCGRFDAACWCAGVKFRPELLAQVPVAERGRDCICERCVRTAQKSAAIDDYEDHARNHE